MNSKAGGGGVSPCCWGFRLPRVSGPKGKVTISDESNQFRAGNRSGEDSERKLPSHCQRGNLWVVKPYGHLGPDRIRTSMSHGRSVGRGFESRQVHQIAVAQHVRGLRKRNDVINGVPVKFRQQRLQYCGPELVSTAETMVGSSCRKWTLSISAYQTKNAKSILAKVASWFRLPEFGFAPAVELA